MRALLPVRVHSSPECLDDNTVVEFLDGALSMEAREQVEGHVADCDTCRRLIAEIGRAASVVAIASDTPEPVDLAMSPTAPAGGDAHVALSPGQTVGRFVVLGRIGSGGMGVVFAAYDPKLDRKVALKLLRNPDDERIPPHDAQMRLRREAQAIAQLSHPNVIQVYDVGTYQSEVYIAMEFVDGQTLTRWLRKWERPWKDILDKFLQAGRALAAAHQGGLMHRDFKPDNVLVGKDERVRVMDFGLARSLFFDGDSVSRALDVVSIPISDSGNVLGQPLTKTGTVLGTPRFMAPEQFAGQDTDARSDQFSFCVALYESLYGYHPFPDNNAAGLVKSPQHTQVRPPPDDTRVPGWLHATIVRGLAADPMRRWASMSALLRALAPRPEPTRSIVALLAAGVAAVALATSVYLYRDRSKVVDDVVLLEQQLSLVTRDADGLTAKIKELQKQIDMAPGRITELENELARTQRKLENAVSELVETRKQLEAAQSRPVRPDKPVVPKPAAPPPVHLAEQRERLLRAEIDGIRADLDVCFSEWRERADISQPVFAVQMQIDGQGIPAVVRKGGLADADQVVYDCVTGGLTVLRLPPTNDTTMVNLGFANTPEGLSYTIEVIDIMSGVDSASR